MTTFRKSNTRWRDGRSAAVNVVEGYGLLLPYPLAGKLARRGLRSLLGVRSARRQRKSGSDEDRRNHQREQCPSQVHGPSKCTVQATSAASVLDGLDDIACS